MILTVDERGPAARFWRDTQLRREPLPLGSRIVVTPEPVGHVAAFGDALDAALAAPLDREPLTAALRADMRLTIVCSDLTRPCPVVAPPDPRQRIVEAVLERAATAGVDDVEIIVGRGLHRRLGNAELLQLLGARVVNSFAPIDALHHHDAVDPATLTETATGTFNRRVVESDLVVVIDVNVGDGNDHRVGALVGDVTTARRAPAALPTGPQLFHVTATLAPGRPNGPFDDGHGSNPATRLIDMLGNVVRPLLATLPGGAVVGRLAPPTRVLGVHAGSRDAVIAASAATLRPLAVMPGEPTDVMTLGIPHTIGISFGGRADPLAALAGGLGTAFTAGAGALVRQGGVVIVTHPLRPRFDSAHHPATIEFYEHVLDDTGLPGDLAAVEATLTGDDWYRHLYRAAAAFHAATPFALWEALDPVRRHAAKIIAVGADVAVARRLGLTPASTLADALSIATDVIGSAPSITHLTDVTTLVAAED